MNGSMDSLGLKVGRASPVWYAMWYAMWYAVWYAMWYAAHTRLRADPEAQHC